MLPQSPGQAAWHSLRNRKAPWNSGPCSVLASQQTWGNQQVEWQKLHRGVSPTLSACSVAFPLILVLLVIPQKGIFTSWTQMIPEPNNMAGCPLCPPQHCREGLVVSCVDLVPVSCSPKFSVLGKQKAQGEQSECFNLVLSLGWFWPICLPCDLGCVFL